MSNKLMPVFRSQAEFSKWNSKQRDIAYKGMKHEEVHSVEDFAQVLSNEGFSNVVMHKENGEVTRVTATFKEEV